MRLVILAFAALVAPASALFEDQAGKIDWGRENIGGVTHALFQLAGTSRLAIVATAQGVLAGVDVRSGATQWRQLLHSGEEVCELLAGPGVVLSLGTAPHGARTVGTARLWNVRGELLWDFLIELPLGAASPGCPSALFMREEAQSKKPPHTLLLGWGDTVTALDESAGHTLWQWRSEGLEVQRLALGSAGEVAAYGLKRGSAAGGGVFRARLSLEGGVQSSLETLSGGTAASERMLLTKEETLLAIDQSRKALLVAVSGSSRLSSVPLSSLGSCGDASAPQLPSLEPLSLPRAALLKLSPRCSLLLEIGTDASLQLARKVEGEHRFAAADREGLTTLTLATAIEDGSGSRLSHEVLELSDAPPKGRLVLSWTAPELLGQIEGARGSLRAAWLNTYPRKGGAGFGQRLLVAMADDSLALLQAANGRASWVREEALAEVTGAELLPLPIMAVDAGEGSAQPYFGFALQHLVAGVRRRLADTVAGPTAAHGQPEAAPLHADAYGTRQVVLLRTAASKLFGLHSSNGAILWSRFVAPTSPGAAAPSLRHMCTVRDANHAAQLAVLVQEESSWRLLLLNPFSGRVIAEEAHQGQLLHSAKLPLATAESEHCLLLVDADLAVTLYPPSAACKAQLEASFADIFFHTLSKPQLQGYGLERAKGGGFSAAARWGMQLPEGDIFSAALPQEAAVHSPVRIKGDRSVLYKYVNRNLLAVGAVLSGGDEDAEGSVQVMLVDGVSGRVLHSASHAGGAGPLSLVMGEHYLLYSFWKPGVHQHLIAVSELYTNTSTSDSVLDVVTKLALSGPLDYSERKNQFDSYASPPPHVLSQAYAFATSVSAMGLTLTAKGMTPKHVLVATADGKLLSLEKRLLDPRRPQVAPQKMSQQDREEGLIPYAASLGGINPLTVVSHRHRIAKPRAIISAPTMLESTSLVLAYGIDLFLTRVAPAREFDRLNEDFNYLALIAATAFLIIATLGSTWLSGRKELGKAWK